MTDFVLDRGVLPVPPAAAPPVRDIPAVPPRPQEPFAFTGDAREYFGIWVVNIFLTIVTLGIYSAWAKVRKKRYFYGNTWVAGNNFEYHGDAVAILKGRVIAFAAFLAYTLGSGFSPRIAAFVVLSLAPLAPWLIARSMAFNAANSSYRNLRFHFDGTYRDVALAIAPLVLVPIAWFAIPEPEFTPDNMMDIWPMYLGPLALLVAYPYVIGSLKLLAVRRSRYGEARFACAAQIKSFYAIYAFAALLFVVLAMVFSLFLPVIFMIPDIGWSGIPALYLVLGAILMGYTQARIANLVFGNAKLAPGMAFSSKLSARTLAKLYAVNLLAIACTLGLAIPWASVRIARYRMECLAFSRGAELAEILGQPPRTVGATGEAMGEMFDVDLSL
jgi:uncharacterized membrane protein YjgN (DUF898 family)